MSFYKAGVRRTMELKNIVENIALFIISCWNKLTQNTKQNIQISNCVFNIRVTVEESNTDNKNTPLIK